MMRQRPRWRQSPVRVGVSSVGGSRHRLEHCLVLRDSFLQESDERFLLTHETGERVARGR